MKKLIIALVVVMIGLSSCNINIPFIPQPEECPLP